VYVTTHTLPTRQSLYVQRNIEVRCVNIVAVEKL